MTATTNGIKQDLDKVKEATDKIKVEPIDVNKSRAFISTVTIFSGLLLFYLYKVFFQTSFNVYLTSDELFKNKKTIFYIGIIILLVLVKKVMDYFMNIRLEDKVMGQFKNITNIDKFNKYLIMVLTLLVPLNNVNIYNKNEYLIIFIGLTIVSLISLSIINSYIPETLIYYNSEDLSTEEQQNKNIIKHIISFVIMISILVFILSKIIMKGQGMIAFMFPIVINVLSFLYVHFSNNKNATKFGYWLISYIYLLFLIPDNIQTIGIFSILYAFVIVGMDYSNLSFFKGIEVVEEETN